MAKAGTVRLTAARRTAVLKALADPRRFELLKRLARARKPLCCGAARQGLKVSAATLSHHIKELEAAGLLHVERDGKFHLLSARPETLAALETALEALRPRACQGKPLRG